MTFISREVIEARARDLWHRHALEPGFDAERLLDDLDLDLLWEEVADEHGGQVLGQLVAQERLVVLNERHREALEERGGRLRRYTVGHEIGHWELHAGALRSGVMSLVEGGRTACRDRARQRIERQAEMFAAALLMPREGVASAVPQVPWHGWSAVYDLADVFVVNVTPMVIRLEELGFARRGSDGVPTSRSVVAPGQGQLFA